MYAKIKIPSIRCKSNSVSNKRLYSGEAHNKTELYQFHVKNGGQMVPFAGWEMPVSYAGLGSVDSHLHTRNKASIFDVSHMLQLKIVGKDREEFLERVVVADIQAMKHQTGAYSLMLNESGGVIDDVIVSKYEDHIYFVSNAGCADKDYQHLENQAKEFQNKGKDVSFERIGGSLIAIQGPSAASAVSTFLGDDYVKSIYFMNGRPNVSIAGIPNCRITRCGYTGEDGFEIGVPSNKAEELVEALLSNSDVKLAGLAARDSLRLEAGLALYGNDLNEEISPIQASLLWTISKRRRENPTFIGNERFSNELKNGVSIKKLGLIGKAGRIPRSGFSLFLSPDSTNPVGYISSGGFSPCLKVPIAMAYVDKTKIEGKVEDIQTFYASQATGKPTIPLSTTKMPFVKTNYYSPPKNQILGLTLFCISGHHWL